MKTNGLTGFFFFFLHSLDTVFGIAELKGAGKSWTPFGGRKTGSGHVHLKIGQKEGQEGKTFRS